MTTPATDLDQLQHLDWDPTIWCGMAPCAEEPFSAFQVAVMTMPCCVNRRPICTRCTHLVLNIVVFHRPLACANHGLSACAHSVFTFEPLP